MAKEVYTITADWPAIHAACAALDRARVTAPLRCIGHTGIYDAFGGAYWAREYESITGLVRLIESAKLIREDAWKRLHSASGVRAKRERIALARAVCRTVLALDELDRLLAETGLVERAGRDVLCGIEDGRVSLTGLCWLVGLQLDDRVVTLAMVSDFAETGDLAALRAALEAAPRDTDREGNF